jgi:hypothetical protein
MTDQPGIDTLLVKGMPTRSGVEIYRLTIRQTYGAFVDKYCNHDDALIAFEKMVYIGTSLVRKSNVHNK